MLGAGGRTPEWKAGRVAIVSLLLSQSIANIYIAETIVKFQIDGD